MIWMIGYFASVVAACLFLTGLIFAAGKENEVGPWEVIIASMIWPITLAAMLGVLIREAGPQ